MNFHEMMYKKARQGDAHIVLPESLDVRIQRAAVTALEMGLVKKISFVGNPDEIFSASKQEGVDISKIDIVNHTNAENFDAFTHIYYELRKHKGIGKKDAVDTLKDPIYYAAMMVREEFADGMIAGAVCSSAHFIRAALKVIGIKSGIKTVSSCFIMILPDSSFGYNGQMIFADCATVPCPNALQLAEIAIESAETGKQLLGMEPVIAMLSFSTKGSATCDIVNRVVEATQTVRKKRPDLIVDGDIQADAALIPSVAKQKCPGSPVGGKANTLIFPDLNSGNIAYKLVQRLAQAKAYGPILQGLAKPSNDLSRGCSVDDIVNVIAITSVQTFSYS